MGRLDPSLRIRLFNEARRPSPTAEIILSEAAFKALGEPERVKLEYSLMRGAIRLTPTTEHGVGTRSVRRVSGGIKLGKASTLVFHTGLRPGRYNMTRPGVFARES